MSDSNDKYDSLKKKIDDIAQKYISATGNVGLAVGVIDGDHENAMFYGSIDRDSETPPDENTIFEIGSIGKVFTALRFRRPMLFTVDRTVQ